MLSVAAVGQEGPIHNGYGVSEELQSPSRDLMLALSSCMPPHDGFPKSDGHAWSDDDKTGVRAARELHIELPWIYVMPSAYWGGRQSLP